MLPGDVCVLWLRVVYVLFLCYLVLDVLFRLVLHCMWFGVVWHSLVYTVDLLLYVCVVCIAWLSVCVWGGVWSSVVCIACPGVCWLCGLVLLVLLS